MAKRFSRHDPKIGTIVYDGLKQQDVEVINRYIFKEQKWYVVMDDLEQYVRAQENIKALG